MSLPRPTIRRIVTATAVAATGALVMAGCSSGSSAASIDESAPKELKGTVSLWHFFTGREAGVVKSAVDGFEKANPGVTVDIHAGQDDEKLQKAISSGQNIDVGLSYSTAIVGSFCSSGAFRDLSPYIKRDKVDLSDIPKAVQGYTAYKGKRCTLPALADVSALMYNKAAFAKAGITTPPKTLDELKADGLKLTTYNADGSIKQLGFNPLIDFYENSPEHFAPMINGTWLDKQGNSEIGTSAAWKKLITWQKGYVDAIGYDKLKAFTSGLGQEFAADNAFQTGQVAMQIDGEYRTAFIKDQKPDLDYGTAPTPVLEGVGNYGSTYIAGNVAGVAKGSKNPELAWALLKYLSTNTDAQVTLGNGLKNIPTITSALQSPDLEVDANYKTFVDVAGDPKTITSPATADGAAYIGTFTKFWQAYQQNGGDLDAKLKKLDSDIDNANQLAGP
ncbi:MULTISPECIES: extracellular solute-binding protein [unclassified Curtobacterium]|jgi:multiple sugar transport system substrate-binding protein|uniref:extracellular solute-binding protein n=1 Tax=unclassified Curtobacterium TaxID=257496 RepID=UPI00188C1E7A|nr:MULTISPECIES: extracellular solute-binding protein [unclassified Curtobacterium]MBF4589937.1 extracellular solute-binding protein [Curtobacterium sp. VKM Ac-1395]MCY1694567.1 extracellular solute-binding protein [Curtobacterium sp. SL109]